MQTRSNVSRRRVRERRTPGDATGHIHSFCWLQPGDQVVLAVRKSTPCDRQLGHQLANLRRIVREHGLKTVRIVKTVRPGSDPGWLRRAAYLARRYHARAILAESASRLCRSPDYSPVNQSALPSDEDLHWMAEHAEGVPLVTHLDPAATPNEERAYQTKRSPNNGRPRKSQPGELKQRRIELLPRVIEMHRDGASNRDIGRVLAVSESNVRRWLKQHT